MQRRPRLDCIAVAAHLARESRHGAPSDQNYDSEAEILAHATDIDVEAAAGPDATNTAMPDLSGPVHTGPTMAERLQLGQFLACEVNGP